ncbi:MAG: metal ABC transporter substrate-binding protein [Mycoplasmatales bacterium]
MRKIILMMLILVVISGCATNSETNNNLPTIYTTVSPIKYFVTELVGESANVKTVYPPGSDLHSYEVSANELTKILQADILFISSKNAGSFEEKIESVLAENKSDLKVIDISEHELFKAKVPNEQYGQAEIHEEKIKPKSNESHELEKVINDPHYWFSPQKAKLMLEVISHELDINKIITKANQTKLLSLEAGLTELDKKIEEFVKKQTKELIITHDIFYFLKADYGLKYQAVFSSNHDDQPTATDIRRFVDLIKKEQIKIIYQEQNDQQNKVMNTISTETNTQVEILNNLETDITNQNIDYLQIMNDNLSKMELSQN